MNNFIFQNSTNVYFGRGCVKEYLACLTKDAQTVLLAMAEAQSNETASTMRYEAF